MPEIFLRGVLKFQQGQKNIAYLHILMNIFGLTSVVQTFRNGWLQLKNIYSHHKTLSLEDPVSRE